MEKIFGLVDIETIEKLTELTRNKKLDEITIEIHKCRITIKARSYYQSSGMISHATSSQSTPPATLKDNEEHVIKSPIVGIYYQSPAPDKPPYVNVGDTVKKGDVIMIIESMKLMNEIQSEFEGVVDRFLVSNGEAVEFDQPIMVIK